MTRDRLCTDPAPLGEGSLCLKMDKRGRAIQDVQVKPCVQKQCPGILICMYYVKFEDDLTCWRLSFRSAIKLLVVLLLQM